MVIPAIKSQSNILNPSRGYGSMKLGTNGLLIKNTGITPGNYMYWASQLECVAWFTAKAIPNISFNNYTVVRPDPTSKNAFNVAAVHLNCPYDLLTECDYLMFFNDVFARWFICVVTNREYVNEKSTRLYFEIDYVATFWDTLEFGESFIHRTHVTDDWDGNVTASKYLNNEPIAYNAFPRTELNSKDVFVDVNKNLNIPQSNFCLIAAVSADGNLGDPKISYQAGGAMHGYITIGSQSDIENVCTKYISYSSQVLNKGSTYFGNVENIYMAPTLVTKNTSSTPELVTVDKTILGDCIKPEAVSSVRHAKVLDYFRVRVVGPSGDLLISFAEYGNKLSCDAIFSGGIYGCVTLMMNDKNGNYNYQQLQTPQWPSIPIAGAVHSSEYGNAATKAVSAAPNNRQFVEQHPYHYGA